MAERDIQHAVRLALGQYPDRVCVWRNNTGVARQANGRVIRYGLCVGSSDLIGLTSEGQFVAIELKASRGRLSHEQELFLALVRRNGGLAGVARSVTEALSLVGINGA